jgi:hypothetical protein
VSDDFAQWLAANPEPDIGPLIRKAGMRRAAELGEAYDPYKQAHGGCPHITPEEWAEFDRAVRQWQRTRRERYGGAIDNQAARSIQGLRDSVAGRGARHRRQSR